VFAVPLLYVCTVGGSPEPLVAALEKFRPARVLFVVSPDSRASLPRIVETLAAKGYELGPGTRQSVQVRDPDDIVVCVQDMREQLDPEVRRWRAQGSDHDVVADVTGGTKCMSAALALVARPWTGVQFAYVGGAQRTQQGLGVVVSGTERPLIRTNPWDTLGFVTARHNADGSRWLWAIAPRTPVC
jgi:hypothetical protein